MFLSGMNTSKVKKSQLEVDFDEEAQRLWERLNLDPTAHSRGKWNPLDPVWRHPVGGGIIYVGNQTAAEDIGLLNRHRVTHGASQIPNFHEKSGAIHYYRFPISHWKMYCDGSDESIIEFSSPLFKFIEEAILSGSNVMVHCLAGAHRAGSTGCACLVHFAGMDVPTAIHSAKQCRPIIDPIGGLPEFLDRLYTAEQRLKTAGVSDREA